MNATRKHTALAAVLASLPLALATTSLAEETTPEPRALPKPQTADVVGQRYSLAPTTTTAKPADPTAVASRLLADARVAMAAGDRQRAEQLVARASQLNVPESAFGEGADTPSRLALELAQSDSPKYRVDPAVSTAGAETLPGEPAMIQRAVHLPELDKTSNVPVAATVGPHLAPRDTPRLAQLPPPAEPVPAAPKASVWLAQGEQKLRDGDLQGALRLFQAADASRDSLDAGQQRRLADHLRLMSDPAGSAAPVADARVDASMIDQADKDQQVLARQLSTAVGQRQVEARELRQSEPRRSLELLEDMKAEVDGSGLSSHYRELLGRRIDRSIAETKQYIENNRAQIELDEQNASVLADIDRENAAEQRLREKIAEHVEQFNQYLDEQRIEEAEVVVKRLKELAPDDPVVKQVWQNAKFIRRNLFNEEIRELRDEGNWGAIADVESASYINVGDGEELVYSPQWGDLQKNRKSLGELRSQRSPRELEIEQRLKTPVQLRYNDRPLSEVMDSLSRMTGIDIYLDPRGLSQEGVSSDTPVSINLNNEISLKSALSLILTPMNLGYMVKDEVLQVTSESLRDGDIKQRVYYVADLAIPIPNFMPSNNIGLQGLINDALAVTGYGAGGIGAPGPIALANNAPSPTAGAAGQDVLAQNFGSAGGIGTSGGLTTGPAGLGGAASADFDSLIELITSTVAADTWAENGGGEAEIRPNQLTVSLVISQTESVHEEIADLLEQLRRLLDLQVTIEVRFIRLSDDFFERIGIDFDMNINDQILGTDEIVQTDVGSSSGEVVPSGVARRTGGGATVGVQAPLVGDLATVTADLDIPFRQGSFGVAQPTIGGFNPSSAASFGFAILSDIEAYFLITAAQGDSRTNVLNAPKVTLFNGQQAFVSDTSQSPFVISVIPVVGEFAAAQQPVIVVLSEGTLMSIQAVVSEDRRYVRLTVVPFFSEIGDVDTFTFDGQTTTNSSASSSATDGDDDGTNESANNASAAATTVAGTTVQLPTFQFVSVTTTVSVPDGGTVLLGGIKRLSEGREEFGVPLLSKIPYINRLFRNVGIGRETDSLMMMVTPRIIIQEEEEQRLGLAGN